jgi:AAHS family 4-hydroxybenzoate transporter-like MFS transporter
VSSDLSARIRSGNVTALQVVVIAACVVMNAIDGIDVQAIAYTAPVISNAWHISNAALGIVFSAGLVGMAVGALVLGPTGDYIGRRPALLLNLVVMTIGMVGTAYTDTVTSLLILRVVTGLGIGGILATTNAMVAEYSPEKYKNFSLSFMHMGYPIGGVISSPIAAWLIEQYGWQSVFLAGSALSGLMIFVVLFWVPESIDYYLLKQGTGALDKVNAILKKMGRDLLNELPAAPAPHAEGVKKTAVLATLHKPYTAQTFILWAAFFFYFMTLYFVLNWGPDIITNYYHFTRAQGIYGNFWINLFGVAGGLTVGYVSTMHGVRKMTRGFLFVGVAGMVAFGLAGANLTGMYVADCIIGFGFLGVVTGLYTSSARMYPAEIRNSGVALAIGFGRIGAIIGPSLAGYMLTFGLTVTTIYYLFAIPLLLSALAFFVIKYDDPITVGSKAAKQAAE